MALRGDGLLGTKRWCPDHQAHRGPLPRSASRMRDQLCRKM